MSESEVGKRATLIGVAALCLALNVSLGVLVNLIKFPLYLDAIGTIAMAVMGSPNGHRGFLIAAVVGAGSNALAGILFNPAQIWFMGTQVVIAAYAFYLIRPLVQNQLATGRLTPRSGALLVLLGVGLGLVSGIVSAPVIAYVFGGITGSGASLIVAVMLRAGANLFNSVLTSGFIAEPLDKTVQLIAALALVRATPKRIRATIG